MRFKVICVLCLVLLIFSIGYALQDEGLSGFLKIFFKEHKFSGEHSVIHAEDIITESPWVDVRAFGAIGNGVTDDTSPIQDAIDTCPTGGSVFFPVGSYLVSSTITVDREVHLRGEGTIVVDDGSNLDRVVDIQASADGTTLTGITIDQSKVTVSMGEGSGIFISADYCSLENVTVVGQGDVFNEPFEACFDIYGAHCVLVGCVAREAAYAGFRCSGSKNTKIIGCKSLEWRYKGFVVNGSASNIIIDSCIASTQNGASSATNGVLVSTGNHNLDTIILSNIIVDGDYTGTGMKITASEGYAVSNAHITNLSIKASNLEEGLGRVDELTNSDV
ncbi:hypothetical protein H8E77_02155 [bacterium]|nr:hypothetical protein [bacterium]